MKINQHTLHKLLLITSGNISLRNLSILRASILLITFSLVKPVFAQDEKLEEIRLKISSIISTYEANQARFHSQYKGRPLTGRAIVQSVKTDIFGKGSEFYINLKTDWSNTAMFLQCITADRNMAAKFDKNQEINFSGVIDDVTHNRLELVNCTAEIVISDNKPKINKYKGVLPTVAKNTPYLQVRAVLIKEGWRPVPQKRDHPSVDEKRDKGWTEVAYCAGTGEGPCVFIWQNKKEEILEVLTIGSDPLPIVFNGFR